MLNQNPISSCHEGDFGFLVIGASNQICVVGYSSLCHQHGLVIIFTKIISRNFGLDHCLN